MSENSPSLGGNGTCQHVVLIPGADPVDGPMTRCGQRLPCPVHLSSYVVERNLPPIHRSRDYFRDAETSIATSCAGRIPNTNYPYLRGILLALVGIGKELQGLRTDIKERA